MGPSRIHDSGEIMLRKRTTVDGDSSQLMQDWQSLAIGLLTGSGLVGLAFIGPRGQVLHKGTDIGGPVIEWAVADPLPLVNLFDYDYVVDTSPVGSGYSDWVLTLGSNEEARKAELDRIMRETSSILISYAPDGDVFEVFRGDPGWGQYGEPSSSTGLADGDDFISIGEAVGLGSVLGFAMPSTGMPRLTELSAPSALNTGASRTSEFFVASGDATLMVKYSAASAGTVVATLTYVAPNGVTGEPLQLTCTNDTSDQTLNAIEIPGLTNGQYTIKIEAFTNNVTNATVVVVEKG